MRITKDKFGYHIGPVNVTLEIVTDLAAHMPHLATEEEVAKVMNQMLEAMNQPKLDQDEVQYLYKDVREFLGNQKRKAREKEKECHSPTETTTSESAEPKPRSRTKRRSRSTANSGQPKETPTVTGQED